MLLATFRDFFEPERLTSGEPLAPPPDSLSLSIPAHDLSRRHLRIEHNFTVNKMRLVYGVNLMACALLLCGAGTGYTRASRRCRRTGWWCAILPAISAAGGC